MRRSTDLTFTPLPQPDLDRREVQHRAHARIGEIVVHLLRAVRTHGDDADLRAFCANDVMQFRRGDHGHSAARHAAEAIRIDVEQRDDVKAVAVEAAIVGERHAEVAGADDDDVAGAVDAERADQIRL